MLSPTQAFGTQNSCRWLLLVATFLATMPKPDRFTSNANGVTAHSPTSQRPTLYIDPHSATNSPTGTYSANQYQTAYGSPTVATALLRRQSHHSNSPTSSVHRRGSEGAYSPTYSTGRNSYHQHQSNGRRNPGGRRYNMEAYRRWLNGKWRDAKIKCPWVRKVDNWWKYNPKVNKVLTKVGIRKQIQPTPAPYAGQVVPRRHSGRRQSSVSSTQYTGEKYSPVSATRSEGNSYTQSPLEYAGPQGEGGGRNAPDVSSLPTPRPPESFIP